MRGLAKANPDARRRKALGEHYTPQLLAKFLADRLAEKVERKSDVPLRILDPACGDGVLLEALLRSLSEVGFGRFEVTGIEADESALTVARSRLDQFSMQGLHLLHGDFLDRVPLGNSQRDLSEISMKVPELHQAFDVVIANPPYVRTQVLGAERAQRLAARYRLTGRVDLYHAFLVAATEALCPKGLMGIIISNRFLVTQGGASVRGYLAREYEIDEVIDLGDTKLFAAAVLPAIFIGHRREEPADRGSHAARFIKIYSTGKTATCGLSNCGSVASVYDVLRRGENGAYRISNDVFNLTSGDLIIGHDPSQVWALTTAHENEWLRRTRSSAAGIIGDIATVRVGIKTTADEVFIRSDWDTLPLDTQPEVELLRPLLRHEDACRWSLHRGYRPAAKVLYTHETSVGRRRVIDLLDYPRATAYLESHRSRLEGRRYVLESGRQWYEIWVPQDPAAWAAPKIVFPDISSEPRFQLDLNGLLVDGDCYWLTLRPGVPPDAIYLILGLANSSFLARYHDLAFDNKLYSRKRRYMTQYVSKYPYPHLDSSACRKLIALVKRIVHVNRDSASDTQMVEWGQQVDSLVEEAFNRQPAEVTA